MLSRPFVNVVNEYGDAIQLGCFVDTGSAVSIISLPMRREFPRRAIDTTRRELTLWNGYPCDFGETTIRLHDPHSKHVTTPLRVIGKFLRVPVPFHNDRFIILGLNFLMDNAAKPEIAGQPWNLAGHLEVPELHTP